MSKLQKFVLNKAGVGELLKGSAMQTILADAAGQLLNQCGEGYATRATMTDRAGVNLFAESQEAKADNLEHNTLERVVAPYRRK